MYSRHTNLIIAGGVVSETDTDNEKECIALCDANDDCYSVFFNVNTNTCQ